MRAGTAGGADINVSCRRRGTGRGGGEREREGRRRSRTERDRPHGTNRWIENDIGACKLKQRRQM